MAHGIKELDRLAVGFVDKYGSTWHMHPNCEEINGAVSIEKAQEVFNYQVDKTPVVIQGTDIVVPGNFVLSRTDVNEAGETKTTIVYPSVGDRYFPIQNDALLKWITAGVIVPFNVSIESVGTLFNGQTAFVNLILNEHVVRGDQGPTVCRMMYSNSFGGFSYMACVHTTRIVCNNTLRCATAQGEVNKTLRKFRHTRNAAEKIEVHMVELGEVIASTRSHFDQMDLFAEMKVTCDQTNSFLDSLFPIEKDDKGNDKEGRGTTRRLNQRNAIINIFETCDNLQGDIAQTRYALLQAATDWADHESSVRNGDDQMGRFWDGIWGTKDKFKQSALTAIQALR
jgi:phage/plasmid-like protein (TIGR03299 family)